MIREQIVARLTAEALAAAPLPENLSDADPWTRAEVARLAAVRGVPASALWAEQRAQQAHSTAAASSPVATLTAALAEATAAAEIARLARRR